MTLREKLQGQRVGVVLSAGYFGFFGHAGFVEALTASGLRGSAWAGTSAGGLIGSLAAAGVSSASIRDLLLSIRREHFWDPDFFGIAIDSVRNGSRSSGLLKGERFRELLQKHLPVREFSQLPTPLLLVATNLTTQRAVVITDGDLISSVHATCAYPGLFQAVRHQAGLLWDGGIVDKAPALALAETLRERFDVLLVHYLPSHGAPAEPAGPFAYASGLAAGFAAVRRDHFRLQLELLVARGVPTYVVTSQLPKISPKTMQLGAHAIDAGRESTLQALDREPLSWAGAD